MGEMGRGESGGSWRARRRASGMRPFRTARISRRENPRAEKLEGFPLSGGVSPLENENRLASNKGIYRFVLGESGLCGV